MIRQQWLCESRLMQRNGCSCGAVRRGTLWKCAASCSAGNAICCQDRSCAPRREAQSAEPRPRAREASRDAIRQRHARHSAYLKHTEAIFSCCALKKESRIPGIHSTHRLEHPSERKQCVTDAGAAALPPLHVTLQSFEGPHRPLRIGLLLTISWSGLP